MIKRFALAAMTLAFMSVSAHSETETVSPGPTEIQVLRLSNLVSEYAGCGAFFLTALNPQAKALNPDANLRQATADAAALAGKYGNMIGQKIGLMEDAYSARVRLAMENQHNEMGGNFVNFSILVDKYGNRCAEILSNPIDAILQASN